MNVVIETKQHSNITFSLVPALGLPEEPGCAWSSGSAVLAITVATDSVNP